MQNSFEFYAKNYHGTAIGVYNSQLQFLECNKSFKEHFSKSYDLSLSNLLALMTSGEDFLSQMLMFIEMENGVGACRVAYNTGNDRREFKVQLVAQVSDSDKKYICSFEDITEFLFFQKVLVNRSTGLESLDRNSPVGVFKSAISGKILYVNNGLVAMLGYENEHQLYNAQLSDTWAIVSDRDQLLDLLNKNKTVNGFETRWRHKDGTPFWVSLTATSQLNTEGEVVYFEVVAINIDQKKKAEDDLKRLQFGLHNMVDSKTAELKRANDLLLKEVAIRQRAESIYAVLHAIAEETVKTTTLVNLLEFIHNQLSTVIHTPNLYFAFYHPMTDSYTFPYSVDIEDGVEAFIGSESMKGSLTDYVRATGRPLLLDGDGFDEMVEKQLVLSVGTFSEQWMGVPLRGSQGVWGVLVVQSYMMKGVFSNKDLLLFSSLAESISMAIDRYRAEQNRKIIESLYNTVVENLHQGVLMCDPADNILYANNAFSHIIGIPAEELVGISFDSLISRKDAGKTAGVREMRSMGQRNSYQITLITPSDKKIPVSVHGIPRFEESETFQGTIGLFELIEDGESLLEE